MLMAVTEVAVQVHAMHRYWSWERQGVQCPLSDRVVLPETCSEHTAKQKKEYGQPMK
jgi:hypothetical protein